MTLNEFIAQTATVAEVQTGGAFRSAGYGKHCCHPLQCIALHWLIACTVDLLSSGMRVCCMICHLDLPTPATLTSHSQQQQRPEGLQPGAETDTIVGLTCCRIQQNADRQGAAVVSAHLLP